MPLRRLLVSASAALSLVACDNDNFEPSTENLAGTYVATTLEQTTADGETIDFLEAGVTLVVTLTADGQTEGTLFVPAELTDDGEVLNADLEGTWTLDGGTVTFDQTADTFLRETPFSAESEGRLEAAGSLNEGGSLRVVLERQEVA